MPRIFLTGCAGFIGSHTSEFLLSQGYEVIGIDNFDPYYPRKQKEENLKIQLANSAFTFIEGDINDSGLADKLPDGIDTVVHLAAKVGVRPSITDAQGYITANITGTQSVLDMMRKKNISKMVFASSSSVYGNNAAVPFTETDIADYQISPYAAAKRSAELLNHVYHHLYGFNIINLRFFTVFGPRQRPDLAIHKFVGQILNNKPITLYGNGSTSRDYTYVADTVQGICSAVNYLNQHASVLETINIGNSSPISLIDLANTIFELLNCKPNIEYKAMQEGDVNTTFASIEKAQRVLNYKPATPLKIGIENFINWYKAEHASNQV